uniref:Nuclear speckle splicing regulatory protein 1 n=1 Tax=Parasteatoda tepidariorum TaxID=114398 RepID=A0A2L2YH64_PARTP
MESKKSFGLVIPKKAQTLRPKSGGIFGSDSDDDVTTSKKKSSKIPQSKPISSKKIISKEAIDPSIYEYDSIYDDMKAEKAAEVAPKVQKSSRYIDHLLKAADKRKKEYERRVEKKVQVEREKEGDQFKDKEMFVTAAYKKKVQEREEEEERERRENMLNDMMDVTKQKDLSGFYRHFLKQTVGEEKIPVFGERTAIKEEPISDSERELAGSSSKDNVAMKSEENYDDKDLTDDDSSSSENSDQKGGNSYEKSMREYRKKPTKSQFVKDKKSSHVENSKDLSSSESEQEHNDISKTSVNDKRKHRSLSRSDDDVSNDSSKESKIQKKSVSVNSKRNATEDQETGNKQKRVRLDSDSSEVSESLDSELISDKHITSSVSTNGLEKDHDDKETGACKKSRNIFEKRTVGDVFAAAQVRYFQRLAARSG